MQWARWTAAWTIYLIGDLISHLGWRLVHWSALIQGDTPNGPWTETEQGVDYLD